MQEAKYEELEERAGRSAERDAILQLEARARVHQEIRAMQVEGTALTLTDEEMRLIASFRRFQLRMRRDGEVFTWQTRRPEGVVLAADTVEIVAPAEIEDPQ